MALKGGPLIPVRETTVLPTGQGYDWWAEIYDSEDNGLIELEEMHLPPLLGDVDGLHLVDIGTGTGRHALRWSACGARVTAIDFSSGMLARARAKPGAERVEWMVHDVTGRLPLADGSADRVLSALMLEHVPDLDAFFAELRRVCRPGGFVLLSAMHPAMLLLGVQAHFTDRESGAEIRPESHPHEIADYVMAGLRAGLVLEHISEHAVDDELVRRSPRVTRLLGWPLLLLLVFRPPA